MLVCRPFWNGAKLDFKAIDEDIWHSLVLVSSTVWGSYLLRHVWQVVEWAGFLCIVEELSQLTDVTALIQLFLIWPLNWNCINFLSLNRFCLPSLEISRLFLLFLFGLVLSKEALQMLHSGLRASQPLPQSFLLCFDLINLGFVLSIALRTPACQLFT